MFFFFSFHQPLGFNSVPDIFYRLIGYLFEGGIKVEHMHDILLRKNLTVTHLDKPEGKKKNQKTLPAHKLY